MRRHIGSPQDQKRVPTAACSNPTSVPPTRPPCGWPISLPPTAALLHFLVFVHFMLTQKPPHVLLRCLQSSSTLPDTEATSPGEEPFSTKRSWALAVHSSTRQAQGQGQCPRRTPFFPLWRAASSWTRVPLQCHGTNAHLYAEEQAQTTGSPQSPKSSSLNAHTTHGADIPTQPLPHQHLQA